VVQPPSIELSWQNAWVDDDVKDFQKSPILAIRRIHKGELNYHCPSKGAKEDFGSL
jgi:hypothetical protein